MKKWTGVLVAVVCLSAQAAFAEKPAPTYTDVAYGPHEMNVLDLWLAESEGPAPLVIFIHGGGFQAGDKSGANGNVIKKCLASGVSFASINYPFYEEVPLVEILRDNIARAVQFLRYKSGEFNTDKNRIAVYGGSAGAGSSLWLAFHDDLADPGSEDPVLRESTQVAAAGAIATQATYDFPRWYELFESVMDRRAIRAWQMIMADRVLKMYHIDSKKVLKSEAFAPVRRELDMLGMMDAGDPPALLQTFESQITPGDLLHHPRHPEAVKERCDALGMECVLVLDETPEAERVGVADFLLGYLK